MQSALGRIQSERTEKIQVFVYFDKCFSMAVEATSGNIKIAVLAILGLVSEYHARYFSYALGTWRIRINPND
jgi:hypothetical protein